MKTQLLVWALQLALKLILKHVSLDTLLTWIGVEEEVDVNAFQKRGAVYRKLKDMEKTDSTHLLNAALEMGVLLYRTIKK